MDYLGLVPTKIKLQVTTAGNLETLSEQQHKELLEFLTSRLKFGAQNRLTKLQRYARIDKAISTWQKLSKNDTQRLLDEENFGTSKAININLPILATHLEDMTAFFAEVFSSQSQDFYTVPSKEDSRPAKVLADKMNRDTKARRYYSELCKGFRSLLKYNSGGWAVRWESGGGQGQLAQPGNRIESIDMYNHIYDTSITDVTKLSSEAEFSARVTLKNRMWITKKAMRGDLQRVTHLPGFRPTDANNGVAPASVKNATFWKNPPTQAGLNEDGSDTKTAGQSMDWAGYGLELQTEGTKNISGFEVIEMYCWLNPAQFKLLSETPTQETGGTGGTDSKGDEYSLWRFTIIDSAQVCSAVPVAGIGDGEPEIPHYLGFMTDDDTKESYRSIMELMRPFQRFGSFLLNIVIAAARKNVWGLKGYDPAMFDMSKIEQGEVAGLIPSKIPGRDVKTGLMTLDSTTGTDKAMEMLGQSQALMNSMFPSQALPSQVAGIDRAIKNQVAAVMQGVQRRLHMSCKGVDSSIMTPLRLQCYRNISQFDKEGMVGLDEELVAKILGSGLNQLNREAVASEVKEMIYAVIQNSQAAALFDVGDMMTYWSRLMDSPSDLGDFAKPQQPVAQIGPDGKPVPPQVLGASGLAGAPAAQVPAVG